LRYNFIRFIPEAALMYFLLKMAIKKFGFITSNNTFVLNKEIKIIVLVKDSVLLTTS
jgi:hypothetical protein